VLLNYPAAELKTIIEARTGRSSGDDGHLLARANGLSANKSSFKFWAGFFKEVPGYNETGYSLNSWGFDLMPLRRPFLLMDMLLTCRLPIEIEDYWCRRVPYLRPFTSWHRASPMIISRILPPFRITIYFNFS
jgi:hypothetical protein